jgi:hypothetical protein
MTFRILVAALALVLPSPAFADCADDVCDSIQKILAARSGNFAKIRGKPGRDPRGDAIWEGTQPIGKLISSCSIYKRGEGSRFLSHYEYHCEAPGYGSAEQLPLSVAKQIAERLKTAAQASDPKIVWYEDPAAGRLADVEGFKGTQGWYGGDAKTNITMKVEIVLSEAVGNTAAITVFAKPLVRRDLKP